MLNAKTVEHLQPPITGPIKYVNFQILSTPMSAYCESCWMLLNHYQTRPTCWYTEQLFTVSLLATIGLNLNLIRNWSWLYILDLSKIKYFCFHTNYVFQMTGTYVLKLDQSIEFKHELQLLLSSMSDMIATKECDLINKLDIWTHRNVYAKKGKEAVIRKRRHRLAEPSAKQLRRATLAGSSH